MGARDVVEYEVPRPDQPWLRRLSVVMLALAVVWIIGDWFAHHRVRVISVVWMVILGAGLIYQRSTARQPRRLVADAEAIHQPWPLRDLPWSRIDHVKTLGRWDDVVVVILTDGSERRTRFPSEYAERLAEVGGKPLR